MRGGGNTQWLLSQELEQKGCTDCPVVLHRVFSAEQVPSAKSSASHLGIHSAMRGSPVFSKKQCLEPSPSCLCGWFKVLQAYPSPYSRFPPLFPVDGKEREAQIALSLQARRLPRSYEGAALRFSLLMAERSLCPSPVLA